MRLVPAALALLCLAGPAGAAGVDRPVDLDSSGVICHRALGVAAGVTPGGTSWTLAARGLVPSVSPIASLGCETARRPLGAIVSVDFAPTYALFGRDTQERLRQVTSVSAGFVYGSEAVRGGVFALGSLEYAGGGARLLWLPWQRADGNPHGLDARATLFATTVPNFQLVLAYTSANHL